MKKLLVFAVAAMIAGASFGAWDFTASDRSAVELDLDGTATYYNLTEEDFTDFDGASLGTFDLTTDTLGISQYYARTEKADGSDVFGTEYFYTVYTGARPATPTFTSIGGGFQSDIGGTPFVQQWGNNAVGADLLAGLSAGTSYTVEIYGEASGEDSSGSGSYLKYDNNGGATANYAATFDTAAAVPEPATMSLLGLGALAMVLRRKIRK